MNALITALVLAAAPVVFEALPLPGADGPIGFDDLRFSAELRKVLVPAGRTGRIDLIDPDTRAVEAIGGFSAARGGARGHAESTTSADTDGTLLFASDRSRRELVVADVSTRQIVARARLGGGPDYVRWVAPTHEIWVTEPGRKVIEVFRLEGTSPATLVPTGTIAVPDGPESLEIDPGRRRAYTNTWHDATLAIDVRSRTVLGRWSNGCRGARGLALDTRRPLVFVGCEEGEAVALDPDGGQVRGRAAAGAGVDVIAFSEAQSHLYVPGGDSATLTVMAVSDGALVVLGTLPTAPGAHCVTADDRGHVYVCDPGRGRLLAFHDPFRRAARLRSAR